MFRDHTKTMWVLEKIRESVESIPLEVGRYWAKSEQDVSSWTNLSHSLHNNVLTPDNIPEFCLPPRLCKTESALTQLHTHNLLPRSSTRPDAAVQSRPGDAPVSLKARKKPLPFSAEGYGLAGIYESPNTRRKESLFHSTLPAYVLDRRAPAAAAAKEPAHLPPQKTPPGSFPNFSCKSLSESGGTESETPSSGNSSPLSSPNAAQSSLHTQPGHGRLRGATSCPLLNDSRLERGMLPSGSLSVQTSPRSLGSSLTLAPPVLFPLDVLQCQGRFQREHVLPLQGRGKVRLSAQSTTFSTNTFSSLSTVRVRVVSVEGLQDDRSLNCAVNVCLTPGKLQQQRSATIRNSSRPVFNEDFFFTELSRQDLMELQLRLKVVDKPAAGTLRRRGAVIGVITKPLAQLLHLSKKVQE